jgi:protein gp37
MAENSSIEWTDHTFNPWVGCTKVSDGCKNCYAEEMMAKRWGKVQWGVNGQRVRTSEANWKKPLQWNRKAEMLGIRYKVFCASLADVFENKADQQAEIDQWRGQLFDMIRDTPNLDWLLLTKRPELVNETIERVTGATSDVFFLQNKNVWLGTSVENQEQADIRIPELLTIPAAVRFLSMEPLLGEVDLHSGDWGAIGGQFCHKCGEFSWYKDDGNACPKCHKPAMTTHAQIDWVIVGGESGHNARPMHLAWARGVRDQCVSAGVPFLFKQWGEWSYLNDLADGGEKFAKVGKHAAGRLLDGREWNEFPLQ